MLPMAVTSPQDIERRITMAKEVRKYWVKMNMRFNLSSMIDLVWCCIYDIQDGKCNSVDLMGEQMDEDRLYEFKDELDKLLGASTCRKVTSREYGRIKAISEARNVLRYATCISKGMSESDAGYAFFE